MRIQTEVRLQLVERYTDVPVKMAMGAYTNIKITTPEDMGIAAQYL